MRTVTPTEMFAEFPAVSETVSVQDPAAAEVTVTVEVATVAVATPVHPLVLKLPA